MAFSNFGGGLSGKPGSAAGFAMANDANQSKAAPAIGGNPSSTESIDAGSAGGSSRLVRSITATAKTGAAGLRLRCGKKGIEGVVAVERFPPSTT